MTYHPMRLYKWSRTSITLHQQINKSTKQKHKNDLRQHREHQHNGQTQHVHASSVHSLHQIHTSQLCTGHKARGPDIGGTHHHQNVLEGQNEDLGHWIRNDYMNLNTRHFCILR
jgi:hypothetical protein